MKCVVVKLSETRVRLNEVDDAGVVQASTSFACSLDGDELIAWAKTKAPRAESVELGTAVPPPQKPAATGRKSKK